MYQTAAITAENMFSDPIAPANETYDKDKHRTDLGFLNLSISGTWAGTVTLQRSFDDGSTWLDVESYTENAEKALTDYESGVVYRLGIKPGDYTSGTAVVRLSR